MKIKLKRHIVVSSDIKKFLLTMKLSLLFIYLVVFQAYAFDIFSQSSKISLNFKDASVREVIKEIESQGQIHFFFNDNLSELDTKISVNIKDKPLDEALNIALELATMKYEVIRENFVVLLPADKSVKAQPRTITGTVIDPDGQPLVGATIVIKGTTTGTITDVNGNFMITVGEEVQTLVFSYVGMKTMEVDISDKELVNITMEAEAIGIEEVVAVGYGTQKKINLTGSVSEVKSEDLEGRSLVNLAEALQGTAANLNLDQSGVGEEPGATRTINIRGIGTLTGNGGSPYVVVDGIPMNINDVQPNDIESISVMKDAAASAIYGSRAPYGVIIITTKRGQKDKPNLTYNFSRSMRHPTMLPDYASSVKCMEAENIARDNSGRPRYPQEQVDRVKAYYLGEIDYETVTRAPSSPNEWAFSPPQGSHANNNWPKIAFGNWSPTQNHVLSSSGQHGNTNYYFSGGYYDQSDILAYGDALYKKYHFTSNLKTEITNWLNVNLNVKYIQDFSQAPVRTADYTREYHWGHVWLTSPMHAYHSPNGDLLAHWALEQRDGGRERTKRNQYWINLGGVLEPVEGWQTTINYSWMNMDERWTRFNKTVYYPRVDGTQVVWRYPVQDFKEDNRYRRNNIFNIFSSYEKTLSGHYFKLMVGYEQEYWEYRNLGGVKLGIITPEVPFISSATGTFAENASWSHWATQGVFMRFNYNFNEKYLFEVNGRYDGSSRFQEASEQWGLFPSVSVGYNISKESFWDPIKNIINNLRLRASYGSLGNQDVSQYLYIPLITTTTNLEWIMGSQRPNYTSVPRLVSTTLTWETSRTLNFGLDAGALKNRLNLNFDWFRRETINMFGPSEILPAVLGASPETRNNAELRTEGFDLTISWKDRISKDLSYSADIILGDNKSTVMKYYNPTGNINSWYKGKVVGEIWGYTTEGIFQTNEEVSEHPSQTAIRAGRWQAGDIKYKNLNDDDVINFGNRTLENHGDLSIIGYNIPRFQFGLNIVVNYKRIDFRMFWQGVAKRDYFPTWTIWNRFWGFRGDVNPKGMLDEHMDFWTPEDYVSEWGVGGGAKAYFARPYSSNEIQKNTQVQTRYLLNAAYARLKEVRLGYTIPNTLTRHVKIEKLRIYTSGHNLLTLTKLPMKIDPESISGEAYQNGDATAIYPIQLFYTFGIDVSF